MHKGDLILLPPEDLFGTISQFLNDGFDAQFTVTGNSMCPFLANARDSVTISKVDKTTLKKGDIVLLQTEHGYLLHRINCIKNGNIQTTGDLNCYRDKFTTADNVLGRVVSFTRKGKFVSCQNFCYRFIGYFWRILFPIRPILLKFFRLIRRRKS